MVDLALSQVEVEIPALDHVFIAELVGTLTGKRYPTPFMAFENRDEGELWCERRNRSRRRRPTQWELIEL